MPEERGIFRGTRIGASEKYRRDPYFITQKFQAAAIERRLSIISRMTSKQVDIHRNTGNGGREVKLHPLVLINISDHFTRERVRDVTSELYSSSERVAGVLFGVQTGKVVDVLESFEMSYEILDTGVLKFDEQFLSSKKRQCKLFGNVADRAQDVFLFCL